MDQGGWDGVIYEGGLNRILDTADVCLLLLVEREGEVERRRQG